jgi:hypothetical protein
MKYLRIVASAAVVAMALMALVGPGTASATALCKNSANTTTCSEKYGAGTEIKFTNEGTETLTTAFQNNECSESTFHGTITVAVGIVTIGVAFLRRICHCPTTVLKNGSLSITHILGTDNGTVTSSGLEMTTSCSTIFGTVHCIYSTNGTHTGTLTGGNPANLTISSANLPRLTTNALCDESANLDGTYKVSTPAPLFVSEG